MKKLTLFIISILLALTSLCFSGDQRQIETGPEVRIIDNYGETVRLEDDGSIPVTLQDQATPPFIIYANKITNATTLTVAAAKDDTSISVTSVTGISVGNYLGIFNLDLDTFYVGSVLSITDLVLGLDTPIDGPLNIDDVVGTGIRNMAVDGSVTPQVFAFRGQVDPGIDVAFDITRVMFYCVTSTAVELTDFGDITGGLAKGLVVRKTGVSVTTNIFNVKTNIDMKGIMFDWDALSASNPGQGLNGFSGRLTFAGQNKMGVVVRLEPGENLELIVQDNLSSLVSFYMILEGSLAAINY